MWRIFDHGCTVNKTYFLIVLVAAANLIFFAAGAMIGYQIALREKVECYESKK